MRPQRSAAEPIFSARWRRASSWAKELLGPFADELFVVDDEPDIAKTLADLLRLDHHRVDVAPNGRAALEKLRAETYDLVLSDLKMPELDGPASTRLLRGTTRICFGGSSSSLAMR